MFCIFAVKLIFLNQLFLILSAIVAYLIGAIPTAVWYGQRFFGIDVRQHGSGNAGATNVFRVLGKKAGIIVLLIDVLKGVLATSLPIILQKYQLIEADSVPIAQLIFGIIAVVGHVFPIYVGFKGGKGVATMLGVMIALVPWVSLGCFLIFVVVVALSKYVSLGSMISAVAFPILIYLTNNSMIFFWFSVACAAFIVYKHKDNIGRIRAGNENRFVWNAK
jgi:acyl phosphate:glycerol-3-phosphate acyltransferase